MRDFDRARARYERAIQALDERSAGLEQQPTAEQVVTDAMEDEGAENGTLAASGEPLRLADAGFHDLRSLGLSVTQAKRVLAMRESGALESMADLASVPGLPERQVAKLRRVLRD
jgi:hypothetical protein